MLDAICFLCFNNKRRQILTNMLNWVNVVNIISLPQVESELKHKPCITYMYCQNVIWIYYTCNVIWKFKMHLWHYITERTKQQVVSGVQSYLAISTGLLENSFWTCKKENGGKETVRNMVCGVVNTGKWVKSLVSKRVGCEEEWDRVTCPIRPIPQVLTSSATSTWALYLRLQVWPSSPEHLSSC